MEYPIIPVVFIYFYHVCDIKPNYLLVGKFLIYSICYLEIGIFITQTYCYNLWDL